MIGVNPNKLNNIRLIYSVFLIIILAFIRHIGAPVLFIFVLLIPILVVMWKLRRRIDKSNKGNFLYEVKYRLTNGKYIIIGVLVAIFSVFLEYGLINYGLITYADKFVIHFSTITIIALFMLYYGIKHVHLKFYEKGIVYNCTAFYNWDEVELTKYKDTVKLRIKENSEEILINNHSFKYSFKLDDIMGYYEVFNRNLPKSKI